MEQVIIAIGVPALYLSVLDISLERRPLSILDTVKVNTAISLILYIIFRALGPNHIVALRDLLVVVLRFVLVAFMVTWVFSFKRVENWKWWNIKPNPFRYFSMTAVSCLLSKFLVVVGCLTLTAIILGAT